MICFTDTGYISADELEKVEKMLSHLSEESKQAAATTLVSFPLPSLCLAVAPAQLPWDMEVLLALVAAQCLPTAHQ